MFTDKYAMAVQIKDDLFEIFDVLHIEKESEVNIKYRNATNNGATAISIPIQNNTKIKNFLNQHNILFNLTNTDIDILESQDIYLFMSENKVFSFMVMEKTDPVNQKYQAVFEGNVVIIDVSSEDNIGFGDFWDKEKIIKVL
jgi:hypothetical protein